MKLSIDLSELIQLGKKMLPEGVDFFLDESPIDFDPIDIELSTGKEVSIEDLDPYLLSWPPGSFIYSGPFRAL